MTADDVRKFVTGRMSVSVFSCFKVKPRTGRFESQSVNDRSTFHLEIAIPDLFSNPGISGLKNANPGIPGSRNPGIESRD